MLFEMMSGQRAFAREHTIDTLHAILHDDPPTLPSQSGGPDDLDAIVTRLLQKAPDARFQSAADLAWVSGARDPAWRRGGPTREASAGANSAVLACRASAACMGARDVRAGCDRGWRMGDPYATCRSRVAARDGHAADQRPVARHLTRRAEDCLCRAIQWTASPVGARAGCSRSAARRGHGARIISLLVAGRQIARFLRRCEAEARGPRRRIRPDAGDRALAARWRLGDGR